jgi:GntR family histidine utilization transcriptional repressor
MPPMKSTLSQSAPRTGPKAARAARPEPAAPDQGGLRYQRIKHYVLAQIHGGVWKEGDLIAGEQALAQQFGVSRMTVHRALRELSDEQIVERRQGSGTYVAQQKYYASLVEIRNIADEIAARGHRHRSELHKLERVRLGRALAARMGLPAGSTAYHSVVVHFENGAPIEVEDRYVNPAVAPDYLAQDFASQTPNAYLMRVAPLEGASFEIEARTPTASAAQLLGVAASEPCLVLHRKTRSQGCTASVATLWHPASRYRFTGSF